MRNPSPNSAPGTPRYGARPDTPVEEEHYINMRPVVGQVNDIAGMKARLDYLEERLNELGKEKK